MGWDGEGPINHTVIVQDKKMRSWNILADSNIKKEQNHTQK